MAIKTYILKVASRCNLNCSYCYMYNMGDTTYKSQPKFMSLETVHKFADRLNEYYSQNPQESIFIAFHGGEPLLASKEFYCEAVKYIRETVLNVKIYFTMQTNGTLLDEDWVLLLKELGVQIGISIDGPKKFHDEHRIYHNDKPSYDDVINAFEIRDQHDIGGLITVVNPDIQVEELYQLFQQLKPKVLNLLLPDSNYDNSNFYKNEDISDSKYGDWLIMLYELWKQDDIDTRPDITLFTQIIGAILGNDIADEQIGNQKCEVACIETNGGIEVIDPLRSCGNGFTRNHLNVHRHGIHELEKLDLYKVYTESHSLLAEDCMKCPIKDLCGGGYLVHRYSEKNGFDNPSIYCKDLSKIITYIQNDIVDKLPEQLKEEIDIDKITYDEVRNAILNDEFIVTQNRLKDSLELRAFAKGKRKVYETVNK